MGSKSKPETGQGPGWTEKFTSDGFVPLFVLQIFHLDNTHQCIDGSDETKANWMR